MKKSISIISTLLTLSAVAILVSQSFSQTREPAYRLVDMIKVGGNGGWDLLTVDAQNRRLYVSHATHVVVIDMETDKVVGDIPNTNGVHGIAIVDKLGKGFTTNGRDNSVTIFDLRTLKPIGTVLVGKNPDEIIYDPASKKVFAFNAASDSATVFDPVDGKILGTIDLGGAPEFAVADGRGTIFVNLEDKSEVLRLDAAKLSVISRWPIAPGEEPTGIALDPKTDRLFIAAGNKKMVVMDSKTGKVVADLPTGSGTDGLGFDPDRRLIFTSNGEGTMTVVRENSKDNFSLVENVPTRRGARTLTIDPKTHRIYLPTAEFGPAPAPTKERPRPRPTIIPESFVILVYASQ